MMKQQQLYHGKELLIFLKKTGKKIKPKTGQLLLKE
jgi:hypothetical protein